MLGDLKETLSICNMVVIRSCLLIDEQRVMYDLQLCESMCAFC